MTKELFESIDHDDLAKFRSSLRDEDLAKYHSYPDFSRYPVKESFNNILHIACYAGAENIVRYLVEKKIFDINLPNSFGYVALHCAAIDKNFYIDPLKTDSDQAKINTIKFLLEQPTVIIDYQTYTSYSPLWLGLSTRSSEKIIILLLDAGACPEKKPELVRSNILVSAFRKDYKELVKYLITEKKFDVNTITEARDLLITEALFKNRKDFVELLITYGATIDIGFVYTLIDRIKRYPALIKENPSLKSKIFSKADLNIQDHYGQTSLHIVARERNLDLAEKLLNLGANPNILDRENHSPLSIAVMNGFIEFVEILLKFGADPKIRPSADKNIITYEEIITSNGQFVEDIFSPFHISIIEEKFEIAELFVKYDPVLKDVTGSTLLDYAILHNYFQAATSLIDKGKNTRATDLQSKAQSNFIKFFTKKKIKIEDCDETLLIFPVTTLSCFKKVLKLAFGYFTNYGKISIWDHRRYRLNII